MRRRRPWSSIEALADAVLRDARADRLPIDPDAVAAHAGIVVGTAPVRGFKGGLFRHGEDYGILVSGEAAEGTRRFSIAHELGHFFLAGHHEAAGGLATRKRPQDPAARRIEREADRFAAALLMPADLCRAALASGPVGAAVVQGLARQALVPLTAAALRACELTDARLCVVWSERGAVRAFFQSDAARKVGPHWREWIGTAVSGTGAGIDWSRAMRDTAMRVEELRIGSAATLTFLTADRVSVRRRFPGPC